MMTITCHVMYHVVIGKGWLMARTLAAPGLVCVLWLVMLSFLFLAYPISILLFWLSDCQFVVIYIYLFLYFIFIYLYFFICFIYIISLWFNLFLHLVCCYCYWLDKSLSFSTIEFLNCFLFNKLKKRLRNSIVNQHERSHPVFICRCSFCFF